MFLTEILSNKCNIFTYVQNQSAASNDGPINPYMSPPPPPQPPLWPLTKFFFLTFSSTRSIRGRRRCRSSELYGIDLQGYIYATFAFELAWTILWTYMHYLWLWRNNIRVYLHLCITRLFKMPVILIVIYEMCAMIIACNDWGTI